MESSKQGGRGVVSYYFQKTANSAAEEKISYAIHYKPWDLIIGTGNYISDIDEAVTASIYSMAVIILIVLSSIRRCFILYFKSSCSTYCSYSRCYETCFKRRFNITSQCHFN